MVALPSEKPLAAEPTTGEPTGKGIELPSLTGLRFCSALLVFLYHTTLLSNPIAPANQQSFFGNRHQAYALARLFGSAGYAGVSFFFVLSGFVLTWSLRPTDAERTRGALSVVSTPRRTYESLH